MNHLLHKDGNSEIFESGFTLPELLITLLIIGILAAITVTSISNPKRSGIQNACMSSYSAIQLAISSFQSDSATAKPTLQDLTSNGYLNQSLLESNSFRFSITWSESPTIQLFKSIELNSYLGNAPTACKEL